jgi:hypothetical protein
LATTDPELAIQLLDLIAARCDTMAILHGEDQLLAHRLATDVDMAVSTHPLSIVRGILRQARPNLGARLISVAHSDHGEWCFFFAGSCLGRYAQIDMSYGRLGMNRLGVRNSLVADRGGTGVRYRVAHEKDQFSYLIAKSSHKRDADRLTATIRDYSRSPNEESFSSLAPWAQVAAGRAVLTGGAVWPNPLRRRVFDSFRSVDRLFRPAGVWVHVPTDGKCAPTALEAVVRDLTLGVISTHVHYFSQRRSGSRPLRQLVRQRFKPGVLLTYGPARYGYLADQRVTASKDIDIEQAWAAVTTALENALARRFGLRT